MKIIRIVFVLSLFLFFSCGNDGISDNDRNEIRSLLEMQENAWNEGDIHKFMEGYWQSDSLRFISSGDLKMGWQATLDRYLKSYPDTEAMGELTFEIFDLYPVSCCSAGLSGSFHLDRTIGNLDGYFTLVFRKIKGEWVIISDMTCAN